MQVIKKMQLIRKIDLSVTVGQNSSYDSGGALIINNVTVFTPGSFTGEGGAQVSINAEAVGETDWVNLLQGRPLIEGHTDIHTANYGELIRGTVKAVRVNNENVVADIIIADKSLQDKILIGELRSVSLSFVWDGENNKVNYINHLGVVKLGQVPKAVINLEQQVNKEKTMDEKDQKIEELMKEISTLKEELATLKKQEEEAEAKEADAKEKKAEETKTALEKKIKETEGAYEVALQCQKLGLAVNLQDPAGMTDALLTYKEKLVSKYLPNLKSKGDIDTLFNVALELQKEEGTANINLADKGVLKNFSLGEIIQAKAEGKKVNA